VKVLLPIMIGIVDFFSMSALLLSSFSILVIAQVKYNYYFVD